MSFVVKCRECHKPFLVPSKGSNQKVYCSRECKSKRSVHKFWSRVYKSDNGCWIWKGTKVANSYGVIWFKNYPVRAHRFSWILHFGDIPEGLNVLHNCPNGDNPLCVNPDHLWLGTQSDNVADRVGKNRSANGNRIGVSKLTKSKVIRIRRLHRTGYLKSKLSRMFDVSQSCIGDIVKRKTWKHIK